MSTCGVLHGCSMPQETKATSPWQPTQDCPRTPRHFTWFQTWVCPVGTTSYQPPCCCWRDSGYSWAQATLMRTCWRAITMWLVLPCVPIFNSSMSSIGLKVWESSLLHDFVHEITLLRHVVCGNIQEDWFNWTMGSHNLYSMWPMLPSWHLFLLITWMQPVFQAGTVAPISLEQKRSAVLPPLRFAAFLILFI